MSSEHDHSAEWLEPDGLGGFASGTVGGIRTRRYHALLLAATTPPTGRMVLVNGFEAWVETSAGREPLTSQRYGPGVIHPDGIHRLVGFDAEPWPRWRYALDDGSVVAHEVVAVHGRAGVVVSWELVSPGPRDTTLVVRPLLSGRDYHSLHHENGAFGFDPRREADGALVWQPYPGLPAIWSLANAIYRHRAEWYRNFLYEEERARGLDDTEDLASPGELRFDLSGGPAVWILGTQPPTPSASAGSATSPVALAMHLKERERARRAAFPDALARAADAYIVRRGGGRTIVAGYPWFTDWGRDTFISIRGLCLATGRFEEARDILLEWAATVSEGMLPNRFPDAGGAEPEYNSVDASFWFVVACGELMSTAAEAILDKAGRARLRAAISAIVEGSAAGTRYGIRAEADGLLAAGVPGVQLTWMDARVGDRVITPRVGKPVEVQALWLNALAVAARHDERWLAPLRRGLAAFQRRFWDAERSFLYDVVDVDHIPGRIDASLRPNQILAVGGLPLSLVDEARARLVVETVERHLLTPIGLRTLAPEEPGYVGHYRGGVAERDGAYHQGTVWPWLMGPFVDAWVRVHGADAAARRQARERFVEPLMRHRGEAAGIGHVSEIADGDSPHAPGGCPFQAWSLAELVRLEKQVLHEPLEGRLGAHPAPAPPQAEV